MKNVRQYIKWFDHLRGF